MTATVRAEAHGHGWGGWRGNVVVITPGFYYAPCYYSPYSYYGYDPYYDAPPARRVYYGRDVSAGSISVPVQEKLTRKGYYHGPIDGIVGPGTRAAIAAYQRDHGLEVTGTIDGPLLRSLRL